MRGEEHRFFPGLTWKRGPCAPRQVNDAVGWLLGLGVNEDLDRVRTHFGAVPSPHLAIIPGFGWLYCPRLSSHR